MNAWDKCKNCGGDRGIHHYKTDQCPVNGREAPLTQKQEWKTTIFELDNADNDEMRALLELAIRYLEHPDVLAVTREMALSGEVVNQRIRALLERLPK